MANETEPARSRVPVDLYAFGNAAGPRNATPGGRDIATTPDGEVTSHLPPLPQGASTFSDALEARLTGHYWRLPRGTALPEGIAVVADGVDKVPISPNARGHYTMYPTHEMRFDQFAALYNGLPWEYAGRIR